MSAVEFTLESRVHADGDTRNTGTVIEVDAVRGRAFVRWHKGYAAWIALSRLNLAEDQRHATG